MTRLVRDIEAPLKAEIERLTDEARTDALTIVFHADKIRHLEAENAKLRAAIKKIRYHEGIPRPVEKICLTILKETRALTQQDKR